MYRGGPAQSFQQPVFRLSGHPPRSVVQSGDRRLVDPGFQDLLSGAAILSALQACCDNPFPTY